MNENLQIIEIESDFSLGIVDTISPLIEIVEPVNAVININVDGLAATTIDFVGQTIVTVTHNLGRYPMVWVSTSNGSHIFAADEHLSLNVFQVIFSQPITGTIRYF